MMERTLTQTLWTSPMNSGWWWLPTFLSRPSAMMAKAVPALTIGRCLTAFSGYCARERRGKIYRNGTPHHQPVTYDSRNGMNKVSGQRYLPPSLHTWILLKLPLMPPSPQRKKGGQRRQDQTGQGNEDYGGYRPKWLSWGCRNCFSIPTRNTARDHGALGTVYERAAGKNDRRQSLRFRSAGPSAGHTRCRSDCTTQRKSSETSNTGWPQTAAVQATLESRTTVCLAPKLPETDCPLRVPRPQFLRLRTAGVHGHFAQKVFLG